VAVSPPFRRTALRGAIAVFAVFVVATVTEHVLEVMDAGRLTTDDTFVTVRDRRVRYRLSGAGKAGPTTILVSGFGGTVEQWHDLEDTLAATAPVLMYDRGGLGFSDAADVHDPEGLAGELTDLLQALHVPPPYVVVSYSSSALMARLFVAHHKDDVVGVALLDPVLPRAQLVGDRVLFSMRLKSLVGFTRIMEHRRSHPAPTRREEKEEAVLSSFHHWNATAAEASNLGDWSPRLLAAPAFAPIPVGVLCSFDPIADGRPEEASRRLAAESPRGSFVAIHASHSELLHDPATVPVVLDLIQKVESEAREPAAGTP
jgi:pimeloyl-ACP methyl ester carboxylesterase